VFEEMRPGRIHMLAVDAGIGLLNQTHAPTSTVRDRINVVIGPAMRSHVWSQYLSGALIRPTYPPEP
jgi:hypothetical protein